MHNDGENVLEYIVERAVNGGVYEELNQQFSKGGNGSEVYFDFDISPVTGDNLYRIKLLYQDGTFGYSDPLLVNFTDLIDFSVFPNPASDFIKINLETLIGKEATLQIISGNGSIIKRIEIDEIYSKYFQVDLRELKEGHYVIWVAVPERKPVAKTFVVGKK